MATGSLVQSEYASQVREIHIDFLLEEEFYSDSTFLRDFIASAGFPDQSAKVESVRRSVSDAFGEADLVVVYTTAKGERVAILIEDKLRAPFQPEQSDRYRGRGENGLGLDWESYWTCLVAPEQYIEHGHSFDAAIPLESIAELFTGVDDRRHEFKSQVLLETIRKCESSGVQVVDQVVTEFRRKHYACFHECFAEELRHGRIDDIRTPAPTYKGDTWFDFRSRIRLPKGAYINHKASMGVVDLTFPHTDVGELDHLKPHLEPNMTQVQTGKSAAVRLEIPKIVGFDDFDRERKSVEISFEAVRRLLNWYIRERVHFNTALSESKRPSMAR